MKSVRNRHLQLNLPKGQSAFLWGPRKAGKTYWINSHFPDYPLIDLLKTDMFADYAARPWLLALEEFVTMRKRRNLLDLDGKIDFSEDYDHKCLREGR